MRLLILSDLHLEVWGARAPQIDLDRSQPDAVILAGDIHTGTRAVAWATRTFSNVPVFYVMGNHEGYGEKIDLVREELQEACAATGHVHLLDCGELALGGVRFLGATLWTNFRLRGDDDRQTAMFEAKERSNDYRRIRLAREGYRRIRTADTARWHQEQKSWIAARLAEPFPGRTVVITHMAPSAMSVPDRYTDHPMSPAYASHLDDLVAQADVWVHGHIHDPVDYRIGKCRVVSNPCGYPRNGLPENARFDPAFTVDVD